MAGKQQRDNPPVVNKGGRPKKQICEIIDIENLPTRFHTAEELRGYILNQTNGGRDIVDVLVRDFKSHKTTKAQKVQFGKMLLDLITPEKNGNIEIGMQSPDGKFVFRWQNEVIDA